MQVRCEWLALVDLAIILLALVPQVVSLLDGRAPVTYEPDPKHPSLAGKSTCTFFATLSLTGGIGQVAVLLPETASSLQWAA